MDMCTQIKKCTNPVRDFITKSVLPNIRRNICTYMSERVFVHIRKSMCVYMHVYLHMCTCIFIYVKTCMSLFANAHTQTHVRTLKCTHTNTCTNPWHDSIATPILLSYTHTHTHPLTRIYLQKHVYKHSFTYA